MKTIAAALTHVVLAFALAQSAACASSKVAQKTDRDASSLRAADVKELNALVAQGPLFFETDTDTLTAGSQELLSRIATQMHRVPQVRVLVAGNADERGDTAYNLSLGERRGFAAREYLMKLGVPKARVKVVSLGEERPMADGHDEGAWQQNRRDEFTFMMPGESKSAVNIGVDAAAVTDLVATSSDGQRE